LVNEEGARFEGGLLGSRAVTRGVTPGFLRELVDDDGVSCYQALLDFGLDPEKVEEAQRSPDEFAAYVELHVEQAAVLEDEGLPAGVVTGIAGPKFISVELEGRADHAGATPMDLRRDALAGGAELVLAAERIARCEAGPETVCTVGQLRVSPGATNVIPGSCVLSFDLRDIDLEARDRAEEQLYTEFQRVCSERDLEGTWQTSIGVEPVVLPEELVETIAEACHRAGQEDFRLVSGAAHDAMNFVDVCPVGMVFVRSRDGVSHSPEEYTSPEDAAVGAEIMFHTVCILADACE
jgi:allantoate deiminase